jgi:uncharacterized membrane protein
MKFESHLLSMIVYALLVSIVLGILRRNDFKSRLRYIISLFLIMVAGALIFGWFMFLFAR